jgi:hypothetical protein
MPRKQEALKVPVRKDGHSVLHSTDYARGASSRMEAERVGADYYMAVVQPFEAKLSVRDYSAGDHYVSLMSDAGHFFPMFLTDYFKLAACATVIDGWLPTLTYEICKKGARQYGIRPVKA